MRFFSVLFFFALTSPAHADGMETQGDSAPSAISAPPMAKPTPQSMSAVWTDAQVFPVIRTTGQLGDLGFDARLASQPLAGDLMITYVIDNDSQATAVTTDAITNSGMALPAIHDLAIDNLLEKSGDVVISGSDEGLYFLALDGQSENALLLDHDLWQDITAQVGPIIMTVPAADLVLFVPQHDGDALQIMQEVRDNVLSNRLYGLSEQLFTWNRGTWVVLPEG